MVSNNLSCLPQSDTENQVRSHSPQMSVKLLARDSSKVLHPARQESGTTPVPPSTSGYKHLHSVHIQQMQAQQSLCCSCPIVGSYLKITRTTQNSRMKPVAVLQS